MKIFVSICSYRDPLLHYTLESLIENKSDRHEATYSILEQVVYKDSLEKLYPELVARPDVVYKRVEPQYSDGVGWARKVNSLNVRDEDFFYQIDSHMVFDENWDRYLVEDYKRGVKKSGSKKVIIDGATKTYTLTEKFEPYKHIEASGITTHAKYFMWDKSYILPVHGHHVPPTPDGVERPNRSVPPLDCVPLPPLPPDILIPPSSVTNGNVTLSRWSSSSPPGGPPPAHVAPACRTFLSQHSLNIPKVCPEFTVLWPQVGFT